MGVNLDERERPVLGQGAKNRQGDRMVAPCRQGQGARCRDALEKFLYGGEAFVDAQGIDGGITDIRHTADVERCDPRRVVHPADKPRHVAQRGGTVANGRADFESRMQ